MKRCVIIIFFLFLSFSCSKKKIKDDSMKIKKNSKILKITNNNKFSTGNVIGTIKNSEITEASGITISLENPDHLWTHNDSGHDPILYLINSKNASYAGKVLLKDLKRGDWEDIAIGPSITGEEGNFLYVGDIGDNNSRRIIKKIYFFKEPNLMNSKNKTIEISDFKTIFFSMNDRVRDAEALMIDSNSKNIFIISKSKKKQYIYKLASNNINLNKEQIAKRIVELNLSNYNGKVTASDLSQDGNQCLIKTYNHIFYWEKTEEQDWEDILNNEPSLLNYQGEPKGEAICWSLNGNSFFTTTESKKEEERILYKYLKK